MTPNVDLSRLTERARALLVALGFTLLLIVLLIVVEPEGRAQAPEPNQPRTQSAPTGGLPLTDGPRSSVKPFRGLGTWVDIYDDKQWKDPQAAVRRMANKGVQTLYIETANYRTKVNLFKPRKMGEFIELAHAEGIEVVAWYLPSFENLRRDVRRSKMAIEFRTENDQTFDRFALDIEATVVADLEQRNRRMFRLTERVRELAGEMAIGGITPDPIGSLYWPNFPYAEVAERYDVILPMGYFTYRTSGAKGVRQHVGAGIAALRKQITKDNRIHYIGGLSMDASLTEVRAYRKVIMDRNVMGGGLYDFPDTTASHWDALRTLRKLAP